MLTWLDYFLCILVVILPLELVVQTRRETEANDLAIRLDRNEFKKRLEDDNFSLWLRPFQLDKRISISLIPGVGYVPFSERTKSIPLFPIEVNLYDMFRTFTQENLIHVSEGDNNLPGGGGLTYEDDAWREKVELAIANAENVIFQPFDTPAMEFEFDLLMKHRGFSGIVLFYPVFRTEHPYRKLFRNKRKIVDHLKYYFSENEENDTMKIAESTRKFCAKSNIEYPENLPFPALVRYKEGGEIDAICSLYHDKTTIKNFLKGKRHLKL